MGNGLDRKELIRKRAIFRVLLKRIESVVRKGGGARSADMEFEADAVCLRDVGELDELAPDAVHLLDVVFRVRPDLDTFDFQAETHDRNADLVALVELLLTDERHGKPLPALGEQRRVVPHREHPLSAVSQSPRPSTSA